MRDRAAVAAIIAIWLISTLLWLRPGITRPDGVGYFAYLPSTYFDHDLVLFNEWQRFGMLPDGVIVSEKLTPNGHLSDHWSAGSAVLWYPAFVAGDVLQRALGRFPADGASLPYNAAVISASAILGLITLLTAFAIARRFFSGFASTVAVIGTWFGSTLLWYSTREALMAHAAAAAICALVVLASIEKQWLAAGVAAGLAFAIRPQNAAFIAVPFLIAGAPALRRWLSIVAGFVAGALPQIVVATVIYGNPLRLYNLLPGTSQDAWRAFERFWPWQPLLSWYHGLATWTPLMIIGAAGLIRVSRVDRGLGTAAIAMFLVQWLANASLDRPFWSAASFGQRRFDNCTVFFAIGLAAILDLLPRWLGIAVTALGSLWTMALFFAAQSIDLNRYIPLPELLSAVARSPKRIALLEAVPSSFRGTVVIAFFAVAIAYALFALLIRLRPGIAGASFCALIAVWFAICGLNDAAHLNAWSGVIAKNRALEPDSGAMRDRLALMRDEENYFRMTGNVGEADRTHAEITTLERSIRSAAR